ncbi:MAG: bifunctional folylpolyglutamate synthase/dihydrofolate synthase [Myxococcales bacterium]|nr:bifunctional folylpolyglutamate synthase/dihydrofolate synthase [Myxococcales bacterium]
MSAYAELLRRLYAARRFGVVLGLSRIRALLDTLGAPDRQLGRVVHVAGTNGKGSTVAMISALARAAGQRVAAYTSPHLSSLRERIVIDGAPIGEAELVRAADRVRAAGGDELTFFEQVTAMAMVAIAEAAVDITVLEVGLGGRLDATNVVDADVAVVTGIAFDHEAILGKTIDAIAAEKAGIFKRGQFVVIGTSGDPSATALLEEAAEQAGALSIVVAGNTARIPLLSLPGEHQLRNAACAISAIRALGLPVVGSALTTVVHPGRYERVGNVILDGAHNPDGARALAAQLEHEPGEVALVIAVSADKDAHSIVVPLLPRAAHVVATRYQQDRALAPEALAEVVRSLGVPVDTAPDLRAALEQAEGADVIVVCGSLFLVGEARVLLLGAPADPFVVTDPAPSTG